MTEEQKNRPVRRASGRSGASGCDTIVSSRTVTARKRDRTVEEIHEKAREADRVKQQHLEQERRRKRAAKQKKREFLMFTGVLLLVLAIYLTDSLVGRKPSRAETSLAQMTQAPTETPESRRETEPSETESPETEPPQPVIAAIHAGVGSDVLAEFHSDGTGSQNRFNNLKVACGLLNGVVLEDGGQFSFNDTVGERTTERGFLEASVYTTAENNLEVGGGICQVASTLYECALGSNLQIDERTAHIYTVEYVPYGLDATVNWGSLDLRFTNTTGHPLEIQSEADSSGVTVRLLGTQTSKESIKLTSEIINTYNFETIKDVDYEKDVGYSEWETLPKNGYDVFSYQDIYDENGQLLEHRFVAASYYQKIDLVIRVGPDT